MRKWLVLFLLTVMLTLSGTVLAQDAGTLPVFCGDLSDEDCALLEEAQTAMMGLTEGGFTLSVDMSVPNVEAGEVVNFNISANGSFSGADFDGLDMTAMQDASDIEAFIDSLRDFSAQLEMTLVVPQEAAGSGPNRLTLDVRFVDGFGYINLDELQPILGDSEMTGWGGLDIVSLLSTLVKQQPDIFSQLDSLPGGFDPFLYAGFSDPEFLSAYATVTRTDDGSGAIATFETRIDFSALMTSPEFREVMRGQMEALGEDFDEAELDEALEMNAQIFQNANYVIYQDISTDDALTRGVRIEFDVDLAPAMAAEEMDEDDAGEDGDQGEMTSAPFRMTAFINFIYQDPPEITAPEDAQILPYESLLQSLGAMIGPSDMGDVSDGMGEDEGAEALEMTPTPTSAG